METTEQLQARATAVGLTLTVSPAKLCSCGKETEARYLFKRGEHSVRTNREGAVALLIGCELVQVPVEGVPTPEEELWRTLQEAGVDTTGLFIAGEGPTFFLRKKDCKQILARITPRGDTWQFEVPEALGWRLAKNAADLGLSKTTEAHRAK